MSDSENSAKAAYHHGNLRSALVAEALSIIEREGVDALSLRGLAKAAGVSRAAPYHHFKDKAALLAAVAAQATREFTAAMTAKATGTADPRERLNGLGLGYVTFAADRPDLFRLMQEPLFRDLDDPELESARQESARPLIETVAACLPDADEPRIRAAAAAAWSLVHGMSVLWIDGKLTRMMNQDDLEKAARSITGTLGI